MYLLNTAWSTCMSWCNSCVWFYFRIPKHFKQWLPSLHQLIKYYIEVFGNSEIKSYTQMVPGHRVDSAVFGDIILLPKEISIKDTQLNKLDFDIPRLESPPYICLYTVITSNKSRMHVSITGAWVTEGMKPNWQPSTFKVSKHLLKKACYTSHSFAFYAIPGVAMQSP